MTAQRSKTKSNARRGLLARPLDSLLFLLPLIVLYEVASLIAGGDGIHAGAERVVAFQLLRVFFDLFGVTGFLMPGLAVVAILVATQFFSKQPWRLDKKAAAVMYVEAALWALPLIALNHFTQMAAFDWPAQSLAANIALCIGAGIYEELVFRLALISFIVMIGADLLRFPQSSTLVAAVLIAAGLFALHHHPPLGSEPFEAFRFTFRALAGVYLGTIFVYRGYGPAAGAHIAYNLLIVALGA